jgi:[ribosomal protein S18]-alanine N-acetyltransferase
MKSLPALTVERLAVPDAADFDAIVTLEQESFSNPWTPAALEEMLAAPVTRLYVARTPAGEILAFCACWLIADELHINTIAVKLTMRRQGIAKFLLQEVLERTGMSRATLEVRRSNVAAQKLYEALGFRTTAIRPRYYSNPEEDALILWLNP